MITLQVGLNLIPEGYGWLFFVGIAVLSWIGFTIAGFFEKKKLENLCWDDFKEIPKINDNALRIEYRDQLEALLTLHYDDLLIGEDHLKNATFVLEWLRNLIIYQNFCDNFLLEPRKYEVEKLEMFQLYKRVNAAKPMHPEHMVAHLNGYIRPYIKGGQYSRFKEDVLETC